jgi:hypothetical protein
MPKKGTFKYPSTESETKNVADEMFENVPKSTDNSTVHKVRTIQSYKPTMQYGRSFYNGGEQRERRTQRVELKLPPSMHEYFKNMSAERNISLNEIIIQVLSKHMI